MSFFKLAETQHEEQEAKACHYLLNLMLVESQMKYF